MGSPTSSATSISPANTIASIVRSRNFSRSPNPSRSLIPDNAGVDRLPSFITGPQPQINGGQGGFEGNGGERFPSRRRRRPHGPRPEGIPPRRLHPVTISILEMNS